MDTNRFRFVEGEPKTPAERKKELRAAMKRRRSENENRDLKEELMLRAFFQSDLIERESFFVYLSYSSEAPTDKLIERLLALGKKVYCPRVEGDEMQAVPYSEDLALSAQGIREPLGEAYDGPIEVVIVPLLAVDGQGTRLGYGGGYYDRFFSKREYGCAVGWCYDFQISDTLLPQEAGDRALDGVITDKRTFFKN